MTTIVSSSAALKFSASAAAHKPLRARIAWRQGLLPWLVPLLLILVSIGVFFPIYLNTFHGIRAVDKGLIEMAKSYGLSGWPLYRDVILPGALPSILVGVRFSLGLVWVLLIVAETISAQAGIGYMTMNAREFLQTDVVLVGILLYALLGKLADILARGLERYWLRWHPGYQ